MNELPRPLAIAAFTKLPRVGEGATLVFDDKPLEGVLFGGGAIIPTTPACPVELWWQGLDRSEDCALALASIFAQQPNRLSGIGPVEEFERCLRKMLDAEESSGRGVSARAAICLGGLAALAQAAGRLAEPAAFCQRALGLRLKVAGPDHPDTAAVAQQLASLLERTGKCAEAGRVRQSQLVESLSARTDPASLTVLRTVALELLMEGRVSEAETIYRRLVAQGFELASTHCHLARVCLMTGRDQEAEAETQKAWEHHGAAPGHLKPRILFLQALAAMLAGREAPPFLVGIKAALGEPGSHLVWEIQPVLAHLKPRLTPGQFALLTTLGGALGDRRQLPSLQQLPAWQAATGSRAAIPPPA